MKKQNSKSAITGAARSAAGKKTYTRSTSAKTGVSGLLLGTTGITVLSAAANYVDLPEGLLAEDQHSTDAFEDVPSLRSNNYTQSSSEQRM
jgi:hypothetical protein